MTSKRKFFKTTVVVTVLSEDVPPEFDDLGELHNLITGGDCSGQYAVTEQESVDGPTMAKLLQAQASDPEFFRLTPEGEDSNDG